MCRKDAQNFLEGSRYRPLGGSVRLLMSLLPSLAPQALKGEEFRAGQGGGGGGGPRTQAQAALAFPVRRSTRGGKLCTFPPSSWGLGRPGKVPNVKTEATLCISQRLLREIFADPDTP